MMKLHEDVEFVRELMFKVVQNADLGPVRPGKRVLYRYLDLDYVGD